MLDWGSLNAIHHFLRSYYFSAIPSLVPKKLSFMSSRKKSDDGKLTREEVLSWSKSFETLMRHKGTCVGTCI